MYIKPTSNLIYIISRRKLLFQNICVNLFNSFLKRRIKKKNTFKYHKYLQEQKSYLYLKSSGSTRLDSYNHSSTSIFRTRIYNTHIPKYQFIRINECITSYDYKLISRIKKKTLSPHCRSPPFMLTSARGEADHRKMLGENNLCTSILTITYYNQLKFQIPTKLCMNITQTNRYNLFYKEKSQSDP